MSYNQRLHSICARNIDINTLGIYVRVRTDDYAATASYTAQALHDGYSSFNIDNAVCDTLETSDVNVYPVINNAKMIMKDRVGILGRTLIGTMSDDGISALQIVGGIKQQSAPAGAGGWNKSATLTDEYPSLKLKAVNGKTSFIGNNADGGIWAYVNGTDNSTGNLGFVVSQAGNLLLGTSTDDGASKLQVRGSVLQ